MAEKKAKSSATRPPVEVVVVHETPRPEWKKDAWRKAGLASLLEGFTLVPDGRAAHIYLRRGGHVIDFYSELAGDGGYDIVVFVESIDDVDIDTLDSSQLEGAESNRALSELRAWLDARGARYSI